MHDPSHFITIRQATVADAQAISELHIRSWQWAYQGLLPQIYLDSMGDTLTARIESRRAQLENMPPQLRCWLAQQGEHIVGWAITGPSRDSDVPPTIAEIYALYLSPDVIGKGIGRILFSHVIADLRQRGYHQATLWVLEANTHARKFYEAAGWSPDGTSKIVERPDLTLHEVRYHLTINPQKQP
jgi:ribosomal protein S18 acetylase RimI-like enzyme